MTLGKYTIVKDYIILSVNQNVHSSFHFYQITHTSPQLCISKRIILKESKYCHFCYESTNIQSILVSQDIFCFNQKCTCTGTKYRYQYRYKYPTSNDVTSSIQIIVKSVYLTILYGTTYVRCTIRKKDIPYRTYVVPYANVKFYLFTVQKKITIKIRISVLSSNVRTPVSYQYKDT